VDCFRTIFCYPISDVKYIKSNWNLVLVPVNPGYVVPYGKISPWCLKSLYHFALKLILATKDSCFIFGSHFSMESNCHIIKICREIKLVTPTLNTNFLIFSSSCINDQQTQQPLLFPPFCNICRVTYFNRKLIKRK
jgi:hypothetical protein